MSLHVDVWSDFVCPWCFLVSTSLEKLEASHGVTVAWKSYELRPKGSPPLPENYRAKIEAMRPQMEAMAKSQYDLELNNGPFGIDSRPALIGEKFAEQFDMGAQYHKAVFEAYWLHAQNIEDQTVLGDIVDSLGLNRGDFLNSLTNPQIEALVDADVQLARDYQLNGVPALVFADKFYIPGAQPYEELVRIVDQITQRLEQN